tara:strand:+ start:113 stop:1456 length:1344 start_codon:yes stop_codon:yes gene_type:complete
MRQKRTVQSSIFDVYAEHDIGRELKAMSDWLDAHSEMLEWVAEDLCRPNIQHTGRIGLSAESILRCAILKQYRQLSYEELAFFLEDSLSLQAFARLPFSFRPKKSALQAGISSIRDESWERINQLILKVARQEKIETGRRVRVDSTVTRAPILIPSDSNLLWDAVRIQVRLLQQAQILAGDTRLDWHDHRRVAKNRAHIIQFSRGKNKKQQLYRDLIKVTRNTLGYLGRAQLRLGLIHQDTALIAWQAQASHYQGLIEHVIDQAERRVLKGEQVPAADKVVSLFEEHTDIIVKGSRDVQYGHKLNLATGRSGLVLDVVIEDGNPADSERFIPLLERQIEIYGRAPRQMAADGGYASKYNVQQAKAKGVKDVAFHKKKGLRVEQMTKSDWVYRKLRNFRAGVEAGISYLKRSYGLGRCTWKGLSHFKAYIWSSVVAHNLAVFSRHQAA